MFFSKKERKFRKAYNDYYPLVFSVIYKRVGNMEDSEDICHELFVSLDNKFDEIIEIKNWLMGAVRFEISKII